MDAKHRVRHTHNPGCVGRSQGRYFQYALLHRLGLSISQELKIVLEGCGSQRETAQLKMGTR